MASWEQVEQLLASGDPQDTLKHLQALDKILSTTSEEPPVIPSVPGFEDDVLEFHYERSFPLEEYHMNEFINQEEDNQPLSKGVLTMVSRKYVDVLDCFSPMFADPSCLKDNETTTPNISHSTILPPPTSNAGILSSLRGRSKDEVVPLLVAMDIPTESKVDIALQHFASMY